MADAKVRIVTLGCAKNEVDSEEIAGVLSEAGYRVDGASRRTDVTVINTCGFLEAAKKESIEAIREAVRAKMEGRTGQVIVAGCLSQRMGEELAKLAPGADAYVGVGHMGRFAEIVGQTRSPSNGTPLMDVGKPHHRWANVGTRARSGKPWSAYLKVSEGCDHQCTFCTIPLGRGRSLAAHRHRAKWHHDAKLRHQPPQPVDDGGPLHHEPLAHPVQRQERLLFDRLHRHKTHARTAHRLAHGFSVVAVVLLALPVG